MDIERFWENGSNPPNPPKGQGLVGYTDVGLYMI